MSINKADVRIRSGAFVGTANEVKQKIADAIVLSAVSSIEQVIAEWLPTVARKTGRMQSALRAMLFSQVTGITGTRDFSISFDRSMLGSPHYLQYHDVDWNLNPHFDIGGYIEPTTGGTKPISETEVIKLIREKMKENMHIEFLRIGFSFSSYVSVG